LERDAGVADDAERSERETGGTQERQKSGEEGWSLALDGKGGEAVAYDHDDVGRGKLSAEG
jgi:hypothetical protein